MGRIRTIKPEFPQSESMGKVSRDARLLFLLLFTIVDDSGRTRDSSRLFASLLYPYDDLPICDLETWLSELVRVGVIVRYTANGSNYIQILKWLDHQKIDKPTKSKIPPFDESSTIIRRILDDGSGSGSGSGSGRDLDLSYSSNTPVDTCVSTENDDVESQNHSTNAEAPNRLLEASGNTNGHPSQQNALNWQPGALNAKSLFDEPEEAVDSRQTSVQATNPYANGKTTAKRPKKEKPWATREQVEGLPWASQAIKDAGMMFFDYRTKKNEPMLLASWELNVKRANEDPDFIGKVYQAIEKNWKQWNYELQAVPPAIAKSPHANTYKGEPCWIAITPDGREVPMVTEIGAPVKHADHESAIASARVRYGKGSTVKRGVL